MKIAHVVSTFPPYLGGMGNVAYHMARESDRLGHKVVVFIPEGGGGDRVNVDTFQVKTLKPWVTYGNAAFVPHLFNRLQRFDIVHLHYPFFGGAEAVALLKRLRPSKPKLVITYHMDPLGKGMVAKIMDFYAGIIMPSILSSADSITVSSYDYAENSQIKRLFMERREKFKELPFGISDHFIPQEKDEDLLKKYTLNLKFGIVLFVGGLDSAHFFKGVDGLIRAFSMLKQKDAVLMIVGDGDLRPNYEKLARELGMHSRVLFVGGCGEEDIVKYYNLADIVVLPSMAESFGMVLIEAMACGKPVIASDLPGVRTVVDEGVTGFLVPPGHIDLLTSRLQFMLDREDLCIEYGRRGRQKVLEQYTWDKVGRKLEAIYGEIMKCEVRFAKCEVNRQSSIENRKFSG